MVQRKDDTTEDGPVAHRAVTGRPVDVPTDNSTFGSRKAGEPDPRMRDPEDTNSTFAERVTDARKSTERIVSRKQVKQAENKSVVEDESK
jgi:hypothetical protein